NITSVSLEWQGQATALSHTQKSNDENTVPLNLADSSKTLDLESGTHFFRLRNDNKSSKLLTIEINKSPSLHLYAPLPRDRVEIHKPIRFFWKQSEDLSKYRVEISEDSEFKNILTTFETANAHWEYTPEKLGRFYWHVVGIDHEGFEVAPAYSNEI